ncbi:MAG TPA: carboxypeptidase regulatory-like domain-containing protein [Candidatus Acidoferrales bacterium]|nr:carboxypeptidase regulatory-like domain-containing protein [Candidatus Acidoferrales bacterium]
MQRSCVVLALVVSLTPAWPQGSSGLRGASLRGTVTDPSGAVVPGAVIQLRAPGRQQRARTGGAGQYGFSSLAPGTYQIRVTAKGFSIMQKDGFAVGPASVFDVQMAIQGEAQVINVDDQLRRVTTDPDSNGSAVVMRERQIGVLSDDPDELALQLQALAGPAPGPNGGQMYVDGFTGGNLPPKSSIREVRINSNPFSPEYDHPGFARVEIFTKPGSDAIRGQAFAQYAGRALNSRNPLLAQATRPPFSTQFYGFNLGGPLARNKVSFTLDAEARRIHEDAFILATTLDGGNPARINQAVPTPQSRYSVSPRLDFAISPRNTLVVRYQSVRIGLDNQGVGDFNLASRAYNESQTEHTVQITETAVVTPRAINETRFQYLRAATRDTANSAAPVIDVQGAFTGGGATTGNSSTVINNGELANTSTYTRRNHTLKWGGRVRQSRLTDVSVSNFAGTFTFYTLDQYRSTLAHLGAVPSQFSMNAGTPAARVQQTDAGLFVNDDWRVRPNLTLSYGARYEAQTNMRDRADFAPRIGIAWGLGSLLGSLPGNQPNRPAKTVLRAGFGTFYDRLPLATTLNNLRYNGVTQQSFLILNPTFFPTVPSAAALQALQQPQQLRPVYAGIQAPRLYQTSLAIERQWTASSRLAVTWTNSRGVHLLNTRNINAPVDGVYPSVYPAGGREIRLLTESAGLSRLNQLIASANVNRKKLFLFGYYALSYGMDNNEGLPADPHQPGAEWGPSTYGDIRHRAVLGGTVPLPWKASVSPFLAANSGAPYNITTGLDPGLTGYPAARPSLVTDGVLGGAPGGAPGANVSSCSGAGLVYAAQFGCFNLNPAAGTPVIGRNYGRGPANVNLALRLSRTWAFGHEGQSGTTDTGSGHGMPAPAPTSSSAATRKYNLTFSASTLNALNHANYAPPDGDLSSSYFGQYRSLGGMVVMSHGGAPGAYNRKIDLQLRFTF